MRAIRASNYQELEFLCGTLEYAPTNHLRGLTLLSDNVPVIIVGYDCWTTGAVSMHQWISHPRFLGRDILREAFRFPFEIGDKAVVLATVQSDNKKALELDKRLGFTEIAVVKDAHGPGVDMHILQLRRDECRWYKHNAS